MKINLGDTVGIESKVNTEGRLLIPISLRKKYKIDSKTILTIYPLKNGFYIEKGENNND